MVGRGSGAQIKPVDANNGAAFDAMHTSYLSCRACVVQAEHAGIFFEDDRVESAGIDHEQYGLAINPGLDNRD
ncbi:hypothetical protein AA0311_0825 [Asaia bogorensis NBRC 16594]|uniref:Uncharacterized protein n=1 Tax=Asaia bogorensis NBRC 16594 TaxID=1231624 RepID=A0AAN4R279_9PROT|nr:hypothetical protein AA0311_0825 [Asaia bogorensis NBRC 16594]GEL52970.1 hypothetical protein ABO01nite_09770 [Asaia bogorensis NBRC 16594]